jgi:hypothetical protein
LIFAPLAVRPPFARPPPVPIAQEQARAYITLSISAKKIITFIGVNFYLLGEIFIFLYTNAGIYNIHGGEMIDTLLKAPIACARWETLSRTAEKNVKFFEILLDKADLRWHWALKLQGLLFFR